MARNRRDGRTPSLLRRSAVAALVLTTVLAACTDETDDPEDTPVESEDADATPDDVPTVISDLTVCLVGEDDCPAEIEAAAGTGLLCTGTVDLEGIESPGALDGHITVDGETLLRTAVTGDEVAARDGGALSISFSLGVPMPAGEYGCRFEVAGQITETERTLEGPDGTFWEHRVCDRADAVELGPGVLACTEDTDALPETTTGVACTVGVRPGDQLVQLTYEAELEDGGEFEPVGREIDAGDLPFATANGAAAAPLFGGETGDPLPEGEHTCRFELADGSESSERTFTVGPIEDAEDEDDAADTDGDAGGTDDGDTEGQGDGDD